MIGDVNLLGPQLILMVVGGFLLIADLFIKDRRTLLGIAIAALGGSVLYSTILLADGQVGQTAFDEILVFDQYALFFHFLLAGAAMAAIGASYETLERIPSRRGEYLALILFSTTGLMLLAGTRDLIGIFIALELSSISQFILVGFHKDRLGSEASLKLLAKLMMPIAGRLPFEWIYPTGDKQDERTPKCVKHYEWANVIAGDFHFVKAYMPEKLPGKVIITNTTTPEDVAMLKEAGVKYLITTTPVLDGRSFGTNMMEAALVALAGKGRKLSHAELDEMLVKLQFEPQLQELN
jgi:hypothetical protein